MSASLAEAAVIGVCMDDVKAYWQVADILTPADFSYRGYAEVFSEIRERANAGAPVDMFVIADERPELREVMSGDPMAQAWRRSNLRAYAESVQKAAVSRRVRQAGNQITQLDGDDVLGEAQRLIGACSARVEGGMRHIREFSRMSLDVVEARMQATSDLTGVPTGLPALDDLTGGLQPSDLVVLAALPGVGKTAFALQVTRFAAEHAKKEGNGEHVGFFSLEMSGTQLNDRLIAAAGKFDGKLLRTPKKMEDVDWNRWTTGTSIVSNLPIFIDDHAGITIDVMCARIRQCHAITRFSIIVIDYLQLITPPKADREDIAIGIITRSLKTLAKELGIVILVLSQLNKDFTDRPRLKNLRGSGAIGQDADVVIFLHQPDPAIRAYVEMLLEKQRNGETADLALDFNGKHQTFQQATCRPPSVKNSRAVVADALWDVIDA
jgi:replicative DNA helicase